MLRVAFYDLNFPNAVYVQQKINKKIGVGIIYSYISYMHIYSKFVICCSIMDIFPSLSQEDTPCQLSSSALGALVCRWWYGGICHSLMALAGET